MYIYATLSMEPAQHSRVAPIAARIPSSNAGERGPRANAEIGNYVVYFFIQKYILLSASV